MSILNVLQQQAQEIEAELTPDMDMGTALELYDELAGIGVALAEDGAAINDPRSALEAAQDAHDFEVQATRASDWPR